MADAYFEKGSYARGAVWLTEGAARQEKHTYENRGGVLKTNGAPTAQGAASKE